MPLVFTRPLDKSVWLNGHVISYFSSKTYAVGTQNNCLHERGTQSLSGRVLDSRQRGHGFKPHWRHCVVSLSKNSNPSLVLVQPMKTHPFLTGRLLMGRKESNQTNKLFPCDASFDYNKCLHSGLQIYLRIGGPK